MGLPSGELVELHGEFAKKFNTRIPINPDHFAQMIHPHRGYLSHYPDRHFLFTELVEFYENQIAAGLERVSGRNLFANELSTLCFWMIDHKDKGHLEWNEFNKVLTAFRFDIKDVDGFKTEFKSLLSQQAMRKELLAEHEEPVLRFDLIRNIFLERGL